MLAGVVDSTVAKMMVEREGKADALCDRVLVRIGAAPTILSPHPALKARFEARVCTLRSDLAEPDERSEVAKVLAELASRTPSRSKWSCRHLIGWTQRARTSS
jgi:hypothetical protein